METYDYYGRNRRGESMRGTVESGSPQAVATWLIDTGIFPVSIKAHAPGLDEPQWFTRMSGQLTVTPMDVLVFTRQMANMVRAGLQMMDAIEGIQRTTSSKALAVVLKAVREDLDRGSVLSVAFARHPEVFDDYYVSMVRVGESAGNLESAFRSLYKQIEFDRGMRQRVKSAMRYPTFVMSALAVAMAILTIFVIPSFAKTYANLKVELPLLTRALLGISSFAVNYWWAVLLIVGLLYFLSRMIRELPEVRYVWDRFKLRLPIIGPVIHKATVARFSRSFATAIGADVPLVQAFQLVSKVVDNAFFEDRILQMRRSVEHGELLSRAMRSAGIFSPLELQLISVAERTGEVESAIEEIALLYSEEVEYQVNRLSQTIEPLLLALMGLLVGVLLLGVFLPMWDLGQANFRR
ncbi:MAG TPA: type II secretion system F family protein [Ramlibacter sp.]|nr:type II secretion system F family protein [Ramlibacter sp.]